MADGRRTERDTNELKVCLNTAAVELKCVPTLEGYIALRKEYHPSWPSHMTIIRRFGGWNAALEAVGMVPSNCSRTPLHLPTRRRPAKGSIVIAPMRRRFVKPTPVSSPASKRKLRRYTDDEIISALKRYAGILGEPPSVGQARRDSRVFDWLPEPQTAVYHFGSWRAALEKANLPVKGAFGAIPLRDEDWTQ